MFSNGLTGALHHREVQDVTTGKYVVQSYNGAPFSALPTGGGSYRIAEKMMGLGRAVSMARQTMSRLKSVLKK
jgi:hypothetical protein